MRDNIIIHEICKVYKLGELKEEPFLLPYNNNSSNYKIHTTTGIYVIKLLKDSIKINREYIKLKDEMERKLIEKRVPVRVPKEFNTTKLQYLDNRFFYIYDYIEGTVLNSSDVILEHCRKIGDVLSKIHCSDFYRTEKSPVPYLHIRWRKYLRLAEHKGSPITEVLTNHIKTLETCTEQCNNALNLLPNVKSIVHGNLTCNNVVWQNGNPIVIDLEKLHYDNPYIELLETALLWSGIEEYNVNYNLFNNVTKEYFKEIKRPNINWEVIFDVAYKSKLKDAELNIKRALMIDCKNKDEQKYGEARVEYCVKKVAYYASIKEEILSRLN